MLRAIAAVIFLASLSSLLPAERIPDLPERASIFLQDKKQFDESESLQTLLEEKLSRTEGSKHRLRPGLQIKQKKEDAAFVLQFQLAIHSLDTACPWSQCANAPIHAFLEAVLTDAHGSRLWSKEYACRPTVTSTPADVCAGDLADDLKGAQVNASGQRAGALGWKR